MSLKSWILGYGRAGSDEGSESDQSQSGSDPGSQDDDRGLGDDLTEFGPDEGEGEDDDVHDEFEDLGFASF